MMDKMEERLWGKRGKFDVHQLENGLYVDSEGRYWVAVAPNVVNPNHSKAKSNTDIDVSEMFPRN